MKTLPNTIIGLIEELEEQYPQKCIQPGETAEAAHHYAGRAGLVVELRKRWQSTEKRALKDALNPI